MSEPGRLAVDALVTSWTRALRARNLASKTIVSYTDTVERLTTFALERDLDPLSRRAVEDYLADVAARFKPATVSFRYRALQQWFGWLADEDELEANPMAKMRAPQVPEQPVDILSPDQQRALLAAADGRDFADRRDTAVLHLFIDTGMRLGELTGIQMGDVDLDVDNVVIVTGKGRRTRACPFGVKTAKALDRYLRARARHPLANSPALWLGDRGRGPLTDSGITQILRRRAKEAGVGKIHPHMFRHTFAHSWREAGGGDAELMRLAGWKSRQMLQRYGAAAADARAREAHRRLSPGDRL